MRTRATILALALLTGLAVADVAPAAATTTPAVNASWFAYTPGFAGGVHVAVGNLDGDAEEEIVTAAGPGGGPHVIVWDNVGGVFLPTVQFFAYDPGFRGGVNLAVGDIDADGTSEIITGAGPGGGPHVRVFHLDGGTTPREMFGFFAYTPGFTGGVTVAAGDVDGDSNSTAEIVTGAGEGGGPHVRILRVLGGSSAVELTSFFAYDPGFRGGVSVAAGDTNGDGHDDVITGAGPGGGPHVRIFDYTGSDVNEMYGFFAYDPGFPGGVHVGAGNLDDDPEDEIVTGAGAGGGPHVRVIEDTGSGLAEVTGFFAYDPHFAGGVEVAAGPVSPGGHEIVTAAGPGGGPHVQVFEMLEDPTLSVAPAGNSLTSLENPWDVAEMPNGDLLFTQRYKGIYRWNHSSDTVVELADEPTMSLYREFETGAMGLALDPDFDGVTNRTIYVCQGYTASGTTDIRVTKWQLASNLLSASEVSNVVTGIPLTSGRHGGCRLRFDPDASTSTEKHELYVTTGDAAIGTAPQDLTSLGGKTLKVRTDATNTPAAGNPWFTSVNPNTRMVYTYGHRNGQGLAFRPGTDELYEVEHGPDRDDEVNLLLPGRNYGWNPVPGYDESVPMTDFGLPNFFGIQGAEWSSGYPTIATSGAAFLDDPVWKGWDGSLVVATLKGQHLRVFHIGFDGTMTTQTTALQTTYGRLRTPQPSRDGQHLYVTTDNAGGPVDRILKITPS